jgi:hypothetical protein
MPTPQNAASNPIEAWKVSHATASLGYAPTRPSPLGMESRPCEWKPKGMLSDEQVRRFIEDGFVRVAGAFPREIANAGREALWQATGCNPVDPTTWTRPVVRVGPVNDEHGDPRQQLFFGDSLRFCELKGAGPTLDTGSGSRRTLKVGGDAVAVFGASWRISSGHHLFRTSTAVRIQICRPIGRDLAVDL